jgi:putative SOS response-associated peptidase YedK
MCARYTLTLAQAKAVIAGIIHILAFAPRYNIGPAQRVPVICGTPRGVEIVEMKWGFKSKWSKTLHINAQAERITQAPTFKPLLRQRCLVPMDGFYEWKSDKSPVRFVRRNREVFYVAALWTTDTLSGRTDPATTSSFIVLTTSAIPSVTPIHTRMPFIVREDQYDRWLGDGPPDALLKSPDETPLNFYPVGREVNHVRKENPDLILPVPVEPELF